MRTALMMGLAGMCVGVVTGCAADRPRVVNGIPDKLVVLTFDDSVKSHYTVARPVLEKYGFGATFFITEGFTFHTNPNDYMSWHEIRQLHEAGFEIGNHTRDHMPVTEGTAGRLLEQIEAINAKCIENGIPPTVSFAYPGNFVWIDESVFRTLRDAGIRWARRGTRPELSGPVVERVGFGYEPGEDHPLLIPSAGIPVPGFTMDNLVEAVAMARDGKIAVLQFHGVPEGEHPWVHVTRADFERFMQYLHDEGCTVIAMRDLEKYVNPDTTPSDPMAVIKRRQDERQ